MEFRNKIFKIQNNIECVLFIEFKEFYPDETLNKEGKARRSATKAVLLG